jgi:hypothetical protein
MIDQSPKEDIRDGRRTVYPGHTCPTYSDPSGLVIKTFLSTGRQGTISDKFSENLPLNPLRVRMILIKI